MAFGDFCFDPSNNLLKVMQSDTFAYYVTCTGTNPFASLEESLNSYVTTLGTYISTAYTNSFITATCSNSLTYVQSQMSTNVKSLTGLVFGCESVNDIYTTVVLEGLCTYAFSGLYNLWVLQFIIAIALYVIISIAMVVYHSYVYADDGTQITPAIVANMRNSNDSQYSYVQGDEAHEAHEGHEAHEEHEVHVEIVQIELTAIAVDGNSHKSQAFEKVL